MLRIKTQGVKLQKKSWTEPDERLNSMEIHPL